MAYLLTLTFLVLPLYVWRFSVFGLPTNFLMLWVGVVWLIFILSLTWRKQWGEFFRRSKTIDPRLLVLIVLFSLAACVSLVVGGLSRDNLGQFLVLYVQPLSIFLIAHYVTQTQPQFRPLLKHAAYVFLALAGFLAVVQYFTLWSVPPQWWGNTVEPKRAIGFFSHPDMFSLFIAPLLAWLIPDVLYRLDNLKKHGSILLVFLWLLGCIGLLWSLSRGAWIGLAAAVAVAVVVSAKKKYFIAAGIVLLITAAFIYQTPHLRYRLILPFKGEASTMARFSLWQTADKMIRSSPILGKGIAGYERNFDRYNTDWTLVHYNFPHNFFLNFWIDTGLLGAASFAGLLIYGLWQGLRNRRDTYGFGLLLFLVALAVHGLIDIPYFKNDLAMLFWLIWSISLTRPVRTAP